MKNDGRTDAQKERIGAIQIEDDDNNYKQEAVVDVNSSQKEKREGNLLPGIIISPITTNDMSTRSKKLDRKK
ncbi:MAG: hypothetical protein NC299_12975 [Lachnospiraceae bacterium]|nr:hypothetical protein [Ruminococcus sp.]MCM1276251.1 hypothetical protein [Lachnospiraceae bacterium]